MTKNLKNGFFLEKIKGVLIMSIKRLNIDSIANLNYCLRRHFR